MYLILKNTLDRFLAFFLFITLIIIPIIPITILAIWIEDPGDVFYLQDRVGLNGKKFKVIKFRSMYKDADQRIKESINSGKTDRLNFKEHSQSMTTKVGKVIRKLSIDELPQLWNVLKGEMSFVGPRPEREFFIQQLEKEIKYYNLRHTVKPGLTGWAQVMYPYGASVEDAYRKLQYDLYYIKNHDLLFDVKVLLKTVNIVIFGKGR